MSKDEGLEQRPAIICANRTGGQGKTLVAQMIALGYELGGAPLRLAAADTYAQGETSKLGKLFPGEVAELGIGARLEDIKKDRNTAIGYWDAFGKQLMDGGVITDVGANVISFMWEWAGVRNAGAVLRRRNAALPVLVVPVRAMGQAIEDALNLLEMSFEQEESLPLSARFLVLNEASGGFAKYTTNADYMRLIGMKEKGLKVCRMPLCDSEVWQVMERTHRAVRTLIQMKAEDFETEFEMEPFAASGAHMDLLSWINETLQSFRGCGLVPGGHG